MAKNRTEKMAESNSAPVNEEQPATEEEPNGQEPDTQENPADGTAPAPEDGPEQTPEQGTTDAPEDDKRANALQALVAGVDTEPAPAAAPTGKRVKKTGNTVDLGGDTEAVVVSKYVNLTVDGTNVVARRGDTITAPSDYVERAEAIGAVRRA